MLHRPRVALVVAVMGCGFLIGARRSEGGSLYVANGDGNTISRVDESGNVSTFATSGLNFPTNVAFGSDGNLYAANGNDATIHRFSQSGADLGTFVTVPGGGVSGIAFDASGNLYAGAWFGDGSIHKYSASGLDLGVFANVFYQPNQFGGGSGNFFAIAIDRSGNVVATDDFFSKLYRFSSDGTSLGAFPTDGLPNPASANFHEPFGLAIDHNGNVFVGYSEIVNNIGISAIREFSSTGTDLGDFITVPSGPILGGLAFDSSGNLYVSMYDFGTIEKYAPDGTDLGVFASGLSGPLGITFAPASVPEPGTFVMLLIAVPLLAGARGFLWIRRKRSCYCV